MYKGVTRVGEYSASRLVSDKAKWAKCWLTNSVRRGVVANRYRRAYSNWWDEAPGRRYSAMT